MPRCEVPSSTKTISKRPLAVDLFSGCGGTTLGLRKAGFKVVGALEIDDDAVSTYKANHKNVHLWHQDIRTVEPTDLLKAIGLKKGALDLLVGCPPCQGFSAVRTLNGGRKSVDPRNDLIFEFLRFARELFPKALMMENVPGLLKDRRFSEVEKELEALGYTTSVQIRNAADFGVPQRRLRLIMYATRYGKLEHPSPLSIQFTVREAIGSLKKPGNSGDPCHDILENRAPHVQTLIRQIPRDGGSRGDLGEQAQLPCHKRCNGFSDIYGRMAWDKVSPTITSGCTNPSKGRFLHPVQDRAITPREAALLQSFPSNYQFCATKGKESLAKMIGNAFPPEFIKHHAAAVRKFLSVAAYSNASPR